MAHDIFISYAIEDKPTADAVAFTLEKNRIRCWFTPRDVLPGIAWPQAVMEAINQSRIMVLVFSSQSNDSRQVMNEVERAASKGIPIIPFRIEDVPLSPSMELFISTRHWLDALTPPMEKHLQHLAETVKLILSRESERDQLRANRGAVSPPASAAEALEALNEAIRLAPNNAQSYLDRAEVLNRLGMISQAEADRRMAHQLGLSSAEARPPAYAPPSPTQAARRHAEFGMRFGAWLIDLVIVVAVYFLTSVVVGFIIGASMGLDATDEELNDAIDKAVIILVLLIGAAWAFYLWLANSWGGTLGKRALGLRVVSASDDADDIGPSRGLARLLVYLIGSMPLYLGWFWMLWDDQKQTWHDKAAGSIVVRTR